MKKIHLISLATTIFLFANGAQAQNQATSPYTFYGEIGGSQVDLSGAGGDAKPGAVRFLLGNELNKNLALEVLYTVTVAKESRTGYDASYTGFGVFLKPKMSLIQGTEVFARVGVIRADITASNAGSSQGSDVAYGLGIQAYLSQNIYGQVDWMHSYDRDNVGAKGFTFSLGTRF